MKKRQNYKKEVICLGCGSKKHYNTIICEKCGFDEETMDRLLYYNKRLKSSVEKLAKGCKISLEKAGKLIIYGLQSAYLNGKKEEKN